MGLIDGAGARVAGQRMRFGLWLLLLELAFCLAAVQGGLAGSSFVGYAEVGYGSRSPFAADAGRWCVLLATPSSPVWGG
jgi:hypothetical protein